MHVVVDVRGAGVRVRLMGCATVYTDVLKLLLSLLIVADQSYLGRGSFGSNTIPG